MLRLLEESLAIWRAGGFLMYPLALLAIGLFYGQLRVYFCTRQLAKDAFSLPGHTLLEWEQSLIGEQTPPGQAALAFRQTRHAYLELIDRRVRYFLALVAVCPLLGLLGTVAGMASTFRGLTLSASGDPSLLVSGGISEALVTTQAGLLIAIPGLILIHLIRRQRSFLETAFMERESILIRRLSSLRGEPDSLMATCSNAHAT